MRRLFTTPDIISLHCLEPVCIWGGWGNWWLCVESFTLAGSQGHLPSEFAFSLVRFTLCSFSLSVSVFLSLSVFQSQSVSVSVSFSVSASLSLSLSLCLPLPLSFPLSLVSLSHSLSLSLLHFVSLCLCLSLLSPCLWYLFWVNFKRRACATQAVFKVWVQMTSH